jgi:uncharacterized C2H2 Zn-finger protein
MDIHGCLSRSLSNGTGLSGFCILSLGMYPNRLHGGADVMPSAKRSTKQRPSRRAPAKRGTGSTRAKRGPAPAARNKGLRCPDCDFVARHPMGLGRHRSARHGVLSGRQRRRESSGAWLTRREAARRAGVHYNTIRHWERGGRLRVSRKAGTRGTLVNAGDLDGLVGGGRRGAGGGDARLDALERRFNDLLHGLERLVSSARGGSSRGGTRAKSRARTGG